MNTHSYLKKVEGVLPVQSTATRLTSEFAKMSQINDMFYRHERWKNTEPEKARLKEAKKLHREMGIPFRNIRVASSNIDLQNPFSNQLKSLAKEVFYNLAQ